MGTLQARQLRHVAPRVPRCGRCASRQHGSAGPLRAASDPQQYFGSDGRRKATFEEAFKQGRDDPMAARLPWQFSWQRNERSLTFTNEARAHLVKGFAAKELQIPLEAMDRRIQELVMLLPDLPTKLAVMKPEAVAFLARDTNGLARSLVALKGVFPSADVAGMVVRQPALLMERSAEQLAATAEQLRQLLPDFDTNWLVEQHPQIALDVETFGETLAEAQRMMPKADIGRALRTNPSMIFGFERRSSMIPYDS